MIIGEEDSGKGIQILPGGCLNDGIHSIGNNTGRCSGLPHSEVL